MGFYSTELMSAPSAKSKPGCHSPFGAKTPKGAPFLHIILSAKYWDSDTKKLAYQLRDYGPEVGSWLSRDPMDEWGGANLYGFLFNDPITQADPLGLKALVLDVEGEKGDQEFFDRTAEAYKNSFTLIDALLQNMTSVTDAMFEAAKKTRNVTFNGKGYAGSRAEFVEILKREKESLYIVARAAGYDKSMAKLKTLAALATKDYDELTFTAHGVHDNGGTPIGKVAFNGEFIDTATAISAARAIGQTAKGKFLIISCYRTWTQDQKAGDTKEGISIKPAWGYVNFGKEVTSVGGKVVSEKIVSCSIGFRTIGVNKSLGKKYLGEDQKYEVFDAK